MPVGCQHVMLDSLPVTIASYPFGVRRCAGYLCRPGGHILGSGHDGPLKLPRFSPCVALLLLLEAFLDLLVFPSVASATVDAALLCTPLLEYSLGIPEKWLALVLFTWVVWQDVQSEWRMMFGLGTLRGVAAAAGIALSRRRGSDGPAPRIVAGG